MEIERSYVWLVPSEQDGEVPVEAVVEALASRGWLGAVESANHSGDPERELVLLLRDGLVLRREGDSLVADGDPEKVWAELTAALAVQVRSDGLLMGADGTWEPDPDHAPSSDDVPTGRPDAMMRGLDKVFGLGEPDRTNADDLVDVLLGALDDDLAPLLVASSVELDWSPVAEGWAVGRFRELRAAEYEDIRVTPWGGRLLGQGLGLVVLQQRDGVRYVAPATEDHLDLDDPLTWLSGLTPSFTAEQVVWAKESAWLAEWLTWCANPHLDPESTAAQLLRSQTWSHVALPDLAAALAKTPDADWSAGVLAVLGVPTLAADLHEGRVSATDLEDDETLDAFMPVVPEEPVAARKSGLGRFFGR